MDFEYHTDDKTGRVTKLAMQAADFPDERVLTGIVKAVQNEGTVKIEGPGEQKLEWRPHDCKVEE